MAKGSLENDRPVTAVRTAALPAAMLMVVLASMPAHASTFGDAAERLDGVWSGGLYQLRVDARRAQASMAPDRPFEWQRFLVKDVKGNEIVFTIGTELYEAVVDADTLVLTGTDFRGERVLLRGEPAQDGVEDATGLRGSTD